MRGGIQHYSKKHAYSWEALSHDCYLAWSPSSCHQEPYFPSSPEAEVPHREGREQSSIFILWRHTGVMCQVYVCPTITYSTLLCPPMFYQPSPVELVLAPSTIENSAPKKRGQGRHGRNCECEQRQCLSGKSQSL